MRKIKLFMFYVSHKLFCVNKMKDFKVINFYFFSNQSLNYAICKEMCLELVLNNDIQKKNLQTI
jgi:hypothetical protein